MYIEARYHEVMLSKAQAKSKTEYDDRATHLILGMQFLNFIKKNEHLTSKIMNIMHYLFTKENFREIS